MSCQKSGTRFGDVAALKNGVTAVASRAGNVIGTLGAKIGPFYAEAGLGLGLGAAAAIATRKKIQLNAARRNQAALQTIFKLQNAAALARQGLESSQTDLLRQAREDVLKIVKEDVVTMQDKTWQNNIIRFAADIAEATDPEQISEPGNMAWADQSRRTLAASRLIFITNKSPGWRTPLAVGAAVTAGTLLATGLLREKSRPQSKVNQADTLYLDTLQKFYEQEELVANFNFAQGRELTFQTHGRQVGLPALKKAVGRGARSQPLVKQSGEDDIFLMAGPRGHIHYRVPAEGTAVVLATIPQYGQEDRFFRALSSCLQ